jgi:hypothetical protein
MMQVWIVWSDKPLAAFSSEARARAYIARNKAGANWTCYPTGLNPGESVEAFLPVPNAPQRANANAAH